MWKPSCVLGLAFALSIAGCLEPLAADEPTRSTSASSTAEAGVGNMTAQNATQTRVESCPAGSVGEPFCATRNHWIYGTIEMAKLPVSLSTFAGTMTVRGGSGSGWNLTVTITARGATAPEAQANLANVVFSWSHQEGNLHALRSTASLRQGGQSHQEQASFLLTMPASVVLSLRASSSSGTVSASAFQADPLNLWSASGTVRAEDIIATVARLESASGSVETRRLKADDVTLDTASGRVDAQGEFGAAVLRSSSGSVSANLRPFLNATWTFSSASGSVTVKAPEEARFGYSVSASTTSGRAAIAFKDGSLSGSEKNRKFETHGFSGRAVRTTLTASSASGNVDVGP